MEETGQVEAKRKLAICIPWDSKFVWTYSVKNMLRWQRPDGYEIEYFWGDGWCPAARHNNMVLRALNWGADLIMFNGADHVCDLDILPKMIAHIDDGWDMVHAPVPARGVCGITDEPFSAISYQVIGDLEDVPNPLIKADHKKLRVITSKDPIQQTHIAGTGNVMMKSRILYEHAKMFKGVPFFTEALVVGEAYERVPVMDSNFIHRCTKRIGARMVCDTTIKIKHLDVIAIGEDLQDRFMDKKGQNNWTLNSELKALT